MASLAEHSPELLKEWDYSKNEGINPETLSYGSKTKVWWVCSKDNRHSWQASIDKRTADRGCPLCRNLLVVQGINDFATLHPSLGEEIDEESPLFVPGKFYSIGSDKRLGWRCGLGHTWEATVRNRVGGQGCPTCAGKRVLPGFNDFATRFPNLLPEISKNKNSDFDPTQVFPSNAKSIWWECSQGHEWQASINSRAISSSGCPYCRAETWSRKRRGVKAIFVPGKDDLATRYPSLAQEWNFDLNERLTPADVRSSDKTLVWWDCPKGHAYQNSTWNRVIGSKCTICAGKKVVAGINDFASRNPELVGQFDIERNEGITPYEITAKSLKKYWWKCAEGHSFFASPAVRTKGNGCPVCANYEVLKGFNDFQSKSPELAFEWDISLNGQFKADQVYFDSIKKYFWKCSLGHSFKQSPQGRLRGVGCPVCSNRELLRGFNDIATRYPSLVEEWDFEKNGGKNLDSLFSITHTKHQWVCAEGHRWTASLANRINGAGCPSCANYGYDPNKSSYFYFIKNEDLLSFKIGIANVGTDRLKVWQRFGWETLFYIEGTGRQILKLETMLLRWVRHELKLSQFLTQEDMRGHKGATETFAMDSVDTGEVLKAIEASKAEAFEDASRLKRRK